MNQIDRSPVCVFCQTMSVLPSALKSAVPAIDHTIGTLGRAAELAPSHAVPVIIQTARSPVLVFCHSTRSATVPAAAASCGLPEIGAGRLTLSAPAAGLVALMVPGSGALRLSAPGVGDANDLSVRGPVEGESLQASAAESNRTAGSAKRNSILQDGRVERGIAILRG